MLCSNDKEHHIKPYLSLSGVNNALTLFLLSSFSAYPLEVLSNAILWQRTERHIKPYLSLSGVNKALTLFLYGVGEDVIIFSCY
ncbi:hypothetical protein GCM10008924_03880 [Gracilibacillus halotolerans]